MLRDAVCAILTFVLLGWATPVEAEEPEAQKSATDVQKYQQTRRHFVDSERKAMGVSLEGLTAAERRVDEYLERFRNQDLIQLREDQRNRGLVHHERLFQRRPLYKLIQQMPKGTVLHVHAGAIQNLHSLVKIAISRSDCYIYRQRPGEKPDHQEGCFKIAAEPPLDSRWQLVSKLRNESGDAATFDRRLYESLTLGHEDHGVESIWDEFEACWSRICSLSDHPKIYRDFYRRELETVAAANVQLLELRTFLDFPYRDDRPVVASDAVQDLLSLHADVQKKYPGFQLRIIYSRERSATMKQIEEYLSQAIQLRKDYPNFVSGFDLVGSEDAPHPPLKELVPLFLQAKFKAERAGTTLPLFLHAGETSQPGFGNILDAVLLGTSRIGHGLTLMDHPMLREQIKAQSIPLEICPYSSYILGNICDICQHPARAWFRDGLCICISSDDPGLLGCDLALDWYLVFVGWQLSLSELKKLVQNGIRGSSLPAAERQEMMREWEKRWQHWIAAIDRELQNDPQTLNPGPE